MNMESFRFGMAKIAIILYERRGDPTRLVCINMPVNEGYVGGARSAHMYCSNTAYRSSVLPFRAAKSI